MAENFDIYRLNTTWPPGEVNYPEKLNTFIDRNEDFASEIKGARKDKYTLLENIFEEYIKGTLEKNLNGEYKKFKNMAQEEGLGSYDTYDYVTLYGARIYFGLLPIYTYSITGGSKLDRPYAEIIAGKNGYLDVFDFASSALTYDSSLTYYPDLYNKTYILDLSGSAIGTRVKLNIKPGLIPILGDRIRLILYNINNANYYGIQDSSNKILGTTTDIIFDNAFNFIVMDLTYGSTTYGWHVTNIIRSFS